MNELQNNKLSTNTDMGRVVEEMTNVIRQYKYKSNLQATQNKLLIQHNEQLKLALQSK